jgi:hypothetical protein
MQCDRSSARHRRSEAPHRPQIPPRISPEPYEKRGRACSRRPIRYLALLAYRSVDVSIVTSLACLSSRMPFSDGCRTLRSWVQSVNSTSATVTGRSSVHREHRRSGPALQGRSWALVLPQPVNNFAALLNAESGPDLSGVSQVSAVIIADQD